MVTITYYDDENKQELKVTFKDTESGTAEVDIDFKPEATGETKDPYGLMGALLEMLNSGKDEE